MDLTTIFHLAITILTPVLVGAVGIVIPKVLHLLNINLDAGHTAALEQALENGIGSALSMGQTAGDPFLHNVTIKSAALQKAAAYVQNYAPAAMAYFNLTPANIAEKIDAKLAKMLHVTNTTPPVDTAKSENAATMLIRTAPHPNPALPIVTVNPVIAPTSI